MRLVRTITVVLCLFAIPAYLAAGPPDITKKSKSKTEFTGMLGTMMKLFGGSKPTYEREILKGNIKRVDKMDKKGKLKESQIIDLDREVFITINHKKKKYTEMTFAEWRQMMESGLSGLFSRPQEEQAGEGEEAKPEVHFKFDVSVDTPGDRQEIAGYETEKVVLTLKLEAEGETQDEATGETVKGRGGLIVRSTNWIATSIKSQEEKDFSVKLAKKLNMNPSEGDWQGLMAKVKESNPELAVAMQRLMEESKKLEGVALKRENIFETWGESDKKETVESDNSAKPPKSVGGFLKGFGKKFAKKKKKKDGGPNVLLKTIEEISEFSTAPVRDDAFAIPAKYKREEVKLPRNH